MLTAALAIRPVAAEPEAPAVAALGRFLDTVDTLTAEFLQRVYDADGELIETGEGSFALMRPDRFVWNYRTPVEQTVLADGTNLWMYDVELEQATVAPIGRGAGSPALLLSGRGAVLDSYTVESTFALDGRDWVRLVPNRSDTDFSVVSIGFDAGGLPLELEFVNGLNQTTRIEFSDLTVNEPLEDGTFELDLPPGVDVIGTEG